MRPAALGSLLTRLFYKGEAITRDCAILPADIFEVEDTQLRQQRAKMGVPVISLLKFGISLPNEMPKFSQGVAPGVGLKLLKRAPKILP